MEDVEKKVRTFLSRFFRKHELALDEDILALGLVNSLFSMQLVMFLEKEFQIQVDNADLDRNNFRSIQAIIDFVQRKTQAATAK